MALKKFDRKREKFDLINPVERIPEDHICFVVKDIVETIDFTEANAKFIHTPGEPAYDRELLTLLVLMGAIDKKFSSRDLENAARFDFVYIYLTANATPDFRTIQRFKNDNKELLREAFVKTREIGRKLGIVKLRNLAIDGTTVKASASKNSRYSKIDLLIAKELVEKGIRVDEKEDILYEKESGNIFTSEQLKQLKKELKKEYKIDENKNEKKKKGRKRKNNKIKKITEDKSNDSDFGLKKKVTKIVKQGEKNKSETLKKINKALDRFDEKDLDKVSLTDPDAHWRPNKQHYFELVHNLQIICDTDSRFIIDNMIVDDATDMNQLIPLMEDLQTDIGF
jgi:transposase